LARTYDANLLRSHLIKTSKLSPKHKTGHPTSRFGDRHSVPEGLVGLCWAKMRWVFTGEAVTQESLGAALGAKISSVLALKARDKT
jgi:hypothetical protein